MISIWESSLAYTGLSGGFSFFVIVQQQPFRGNGVIVDTAACEQAFYMLIYMAFSLSYLSATLATLFLGYATPKVHAPNAMDEDLVRFIASMERFWDIPAGLCSVIVLLIVVAVTLFMAANFSLPVVIISAHMAGFLTFLGYYTQCKIVAASRTWNLAVEAHLKQMSANGGATDAGGSE